jgi:hypothetical protein
LQSDAMKHADQNHRRAQADHILEMLRTAGDRGCTNAELWAVAHAAHSRISDLRARGHRIACVREAPGLYRYTLEQSASVNPLRADKFALGEGIG